jgi:signal transduction histidine kinase
VSHELRTPLTAIKGYSHLLLNGAAGELAAPQKQFLQIIDSNAERLTLLIADLLDISRIDNGRLELEIASVDLAAVLREVHDMLAPECQRKSQLVTLSAAPGTGMVLGDRHRLVQVLANLASNACRYTPERGAITLSLTRATDCVRVDVADTGIGIAVEDQTKIFQRFYRAEHPLVQDVAGTGLGLPIAKMLVEMHGGRLWWK